MTDYRNYNPQGGNDTPLPNGMGTPQFTYDAHTPSASEQFTASQTMPDNIQELQKGIKKYGLIGAGYTLYGIVELGGYELVANGIGAALIAVTYVMVICGLRSALMYFRKGR